MKQNTWHVLAKAALETLEDRRMMSASLAAVSLSGGVLQLTADSSGPAPMTVDFGANKTVLQAHSGNVWKSFPVAQVHKIVITGGAEADNVYINPRVNIPAQIDTGNGNDSVRGGGGNDSIVTGNGNDWIKVVRGDNSVVVGSGTDYIDLTRNYDVVVAGSGEDMIDGQGGHALVENASSKTTVMDARHVTTVKAAQPLAAAPVAKTAPALTVGNPTTTPADATATTGGSGGATLSTTAPAEPVVVNKDAPVVAIKLLSGTRQTGLVVNADGLSSTPGEGDLTACTFVWDFGDPAGDHNTINGFNAGHVYDTPGTYTLSLTVTNAAGLSTTATQQVTIAASTRNLIYVDGKTGSDQNDGSADAPLQSFAAAAAKITDNTEILFKAGQTYTVTGSVDISSSNVLIGSYGSGTDPLLDRAPGNGISTFTIDNGTNGVTIQHLQFNCPWAAVTENEQAPKMGNSGIYVGGQNNTIRDCTFLNLDDAVNENKNPVGTLIEDNDAPLDTGVRGYFVWAQGNEQTIVGNTVANSTREHCVRAVGFNELTVYDNNFTNLSRQTTGDTYDISKGCIELHVGSYGYVTDNTVTDGDIRTGPLGLWGENTADITSNCIIEDNQLTNTMIFVQGGSDDIMISNNVIHDDSGEAIVVGSPNGTFESANIKILSNTAINNGTGGNFLYMEGAVKGITLDNNLWIAPSIAPGAYGTAALRIGQADLSSFTEIKNNVWPTGKHGYGYANGGDISIGIEGDGYLTDAQWLAYGTVSGDTFEDVSLTDTSSIYQLNVNGNMVGAAVKLAA